MASTISSEDYSRSQQDHEQVLLGFQGNKEVQGSRISEIGTGFGLADLGLQPRPDLLPDLFWVFSWPLI